MEITTRPPSRRWRRLGVALGCLTLLLAIGLLVPATLGLQQYPLADGAFAGPHDRGALLYQEAVHGPGELRAGDVISFPAPAASTVGGTVTRRVIAMDGAEARTPGDQQDAVWRVQVRENDVERVVLAVPFAGHPQLLVSWLTWPLIAVLLGLAAVGALAMSARPGWRRQRPAPPVPAPGRSLLRPLLRRSAPTEPATDRATSSV